MSSIKYDSLRFDPSSYDSHNIDRLATEQVPENSFVLDIGCATGFMGAYLKEEKGCVVYGVEERKGEYEKARKVLDKVIQGDIEKNETIQKVLLETRNKKFDVILATSLIEHLKAPENFLKNIKGLLGKDGIVIITTPNIAHWSTRLSLLKGKFEYSEYGILDKTHLHFFTPATYKKLFKDSGFAITYYAIDDVGGGYPRFSMVFSNFFPSLFTYQMLIVAVKS